jgi:hypothetical protein
MKHDGFRAIAYLQNGESKLVSRNQRNLGLEALKPSLSKLPVENAIGSLPRTNMDIRAVHN